MEEKQKKWNAVLPMLQEKWLETGAEPELVQLLFTPLQKRIAKTIYPCYEELKYLENLLAETELMDTCANPTPTEQLIYILCRNNYNHPLFIKFLSRQLYVGITEDDSLGEQADYWALRLKQYQTLYSYDGRWLPQLPSVNKAINKMIKQELLFCERKIKDSLSTAQAVRPITTEVQQPVVTNLSVGQLAVMMRLLTDCNIIESTNQNELLKRVAASVVTTRQNKISAESLRVKYYAPDQAALTIATEYIAKMMAMVRKY